MRTTTLGSEGTQVSVIGLGCMGFTSGRVDDATSHNVLRAALDAGVTFFDTADKYGSGRNEEIVGGALARRDDVVIATKFGMLRHPDGTRENRGDPEYVRLACDRSLARLGRDVIDLYYQHRLDPRVPIEETVGAMAELVAAGKVRHLGLCEIGSKTLRRATAVHPIAALQYEYSLWSRDVEAEILPTCRELQTTLVAYSPLGIGFLTGTVTDASDAPSGSRLGKSPRLAPDNLEQNRRLVAALTDVAADLDVTPAQLALAWVLRQHGVVPIPGASTIRHLSEDLAAASIEIPDGTMRQLTELFSLDAVAGTRKSAEGLAMVEG